MRRAGQGTECAGENHALEADVDHARALDDYFTKRGEGERRRRPHGRSDERSRDRRRHETVVERPTRARSAATSARISAASTTETTTDGTPASRCMAVAPVSRAPNTTPVATTAAASSRANNATAIAVYPYPGEIFS